MNINVNTTDKKIVYPIPLTTTSGKIRIKKRSMVFEYGIPHASKQHPFTMNNYVEWQIGYDVAVDDAEKLSTSTLSHLQFLAYNDKKKALFELSELIYYFYTFELIGTDEIDQLINHLSNKNIKFIEELSLIKRSHPIERDINGLAFFESKVEYPLLIHQFQQFEIIAEIIVKEKQRAVGVQAMLYLCFPISELKSPTALIGRCAQTKEYAGLEFNAGNVSILLEMAKVFGMLSRTHNADILAILQLISNQ